YLLLLPRGADRPHVILCQSSVPVIFTTKSMPQAWAFHLPVDIQQSRTRLDQHGDPVSLCLPGERHGYLLDEPHLWGLVQHSQPGSQWGAPVLALSPVGLGTGGRTHRYPDITWLPVRV